MPESPHDDSDARYEEILKRIAQRSPNTSPLEKKQLTDILQMLNVASVLDTIVSRDDLPIRLYGSHLIDTNSTWIGLLIWYHAKTIHAYRELTLMGLWVVRDEQQIQIRIGQRKLKYAQAVYTAEAYHKLIKKHWTPYYKDDGSPPTSDQANWVVKYDQAQRLNIRAQIADYFANWLDGQVPS